MSFFRKVLGNFFICYAENNSDFHSRIFSQSRPSFTLCFWSFFELIFSPVSDNFLPSVLNSLRVWFIWSNRCLVWVGKEFKVTSPSEETSTVKKYNLSPPSNIKVKTQLTERKRWNMSFHYMKYISAFRNLSHAQYQDAFRPFPLWTNSISSWMVFSSPQIILC